MMRPHVLTWLILSLALLAYMLGMMASSMALLAFGGALELWFWLRLARGPSGKAAADS